MFIIPLFVRILYYNTIAVYAYFCEELITSAENNMGMVCYE